MNYLRNFSGCFIALFLSLTFQSCRTPPPAVETEEPVEVEKPKKVVIAYVGGYNADFDVNTVNVKKLTHINYAFINARDGRVVSDNAQDTENLKKLNAKRSENPDFKLLISIGGWSWSKFFSDIMLTPEGRDEFARSAAEFAVNHNLDGIDVDWEYPGVQGDNNAVRPEDKENYTLMFSALRKHLDSLTALNGKPYLLTTAVGGFDRFITHTEMGKVGAILDFVNIMSYDLFTGGERTCGHHTNLYDVPGNPKDRSTARSVRDYIAAGVPAEKIVIGGAFYGRGRFGITEPDSLPYAAASGKIFGASYKQLKADYINKNGFERRWDATAGAPYLWHADSTAFITYDDPGSLALKCDMILEQNLGGIMFWEYSSDSEEELLTVLADKLGVFSE